MSSKKSSLTALLPARKKAERQSLKEARHLLQPKRLALRSMIKLAKSLRALSVTVTVTVSVKVEEALCAVDISSTELTFRPKSVSDRIQIWHSFRFLRRSNFNALDSSPKKFNLSSSAKTSAISSNFCSFRREIDL